MSDECHVRPTSRPKHRKPPAPETPELAQFRADWAARMERAATDELPPEFHSSLHRHTEKCWERPERHTLPGSVNKVWARRCKISGALQEVPR